MPRAPFQILALPCRRTANGFEYAILRRSDSTCWQGIAGGGEDDETPLEAAQREAFEEAGLPSGFVFTPLQATCTVPVTEFKDRGAWDPALYVVPEHCFGVDCTGHEIILSGEHDALKWLPYEDARARLTFDSNQTALWELNQRLHGWGPREGVT